MSTRGNTIMYARERGRRRKVLDVDLNDTPPNEEEEEEDTTPVPVIIISVPEQPFQQDPLPAVPVGPTLPEPIVVEELDDDDVIISSPRAFEQARNTSRRPARTPVIDVDSAVELSLRPPNRRRRIRPRGALPTFNWDRFVNLEASSSSVPVAAPPPPPTVPPPPPPPPSPPKEPAFTCPVCMGPLVEEVTTKCGHIFCKGCIKSAIAAVPKCPTCRRKVTNKDIIRIYLPAAN